MAEQPVAGPSGQQPDAQQHNDFEFLENPELIRAIPELVVYLLKNNIVPQSIVDTFGDNSRTNAQRVRFIQKVLIDNKLIPKNENMTKKGDENAMLYQIRATYSFKQDQMCEALYFFNKMLALIDYQSTGSSQSFSFRASVFENLKYWKECLADLDEAIQITLTDDEFLDKLKKRRDQALNELENAKRLRKEGPAPFSYQPKVEHNSKAFPKIANFIRVETSKKKCRRVLAKRNIPAGEIVAIARPFCHRLLPKRMYTRCHHCLSENNMCLRPCAMCTQTMFCDHDCTTAGRDIHQYECPIIDLMHKMLNQEELLVVRMALKALTCYKTVDALRHFVLNKCQNAHSDALCTIARCYTEDQQALHQILRLRSSEKIREGLDIFRRSILVALITTLMLEHSSLKKKLPKPEDVDFFMDLMMRMAFIADFNVRELKNMTGDAYACAVYPMVSLVNHSCAANIDRYAFKDEMILVTNRKIDESNELTTNLGFDCFVNYFT